MLIDRNTELRSIRGRTLSCAIICKDVKLTERLRLAIRAALAVTASKLNVDQERLIVYL